MFAERLKEARKAKRYSQAEVSRMLGVTQQAVGKWETGRSTPDPQTVARLAEILDTPTDVLLGLRKESGAASAVGRNAFSRYTESQIPVVGTVRAPDGRCAAERFPVADRIVVGIAVGDNADALLQLDQNAERVGRVIDLCIEHYALGVHQFADLHRQTSRPSALPIRLYRYSPTAPSAQVQVVTWSAAALTSAGALATATA